MKMKWIEVKPKQKDWKQQWELRAYDGEHLTGSIVLDNDGDFNSVINGAVELMTATDLEEAKETFYERFDTYLYDEIDYYKGLQTMLEKIRQD